ncbi:MAG: uroporphyrinogen decarboxylase family protein [Armatimonadota bacterium]
MSEITGRERFMAALRREQPDRVPIWELIVNDPVVHAMMGPEGTYLDLVEAELDGATCVENQIFEPVDDEHNRDEWGIVWGYGEGGIPYPAGHPIESWDDLGHWEPPDPDADHRLEHLQELVERFKGRKAIVFLGHDTFEFTHYLRGMDRLLMDYVMNPERVHELSRIVIDYKKRVMQRALEMGADVGLTGDDYAHRHAPIMSPAHFEEFIQPYLAEIVEVTHEQGAPFIKHTDGNIWRIFDLIVDTGIDAIDPLEPIAGMDIGEVKEAYGDRIAVCGNVDCGELLSRGTPEQVVEAVKETIAKASPGGGHIMASSNSIHPAVRPENYRAMIDASMQFGRYPLDEEMVEQYRQRNYIEDITGEEYERFRRV